MITIPFIDNTIFFGKKQDQIKYVYWVFFGIIFFLAIYFPIFGSNLRYEIGTILRFIFNSIGNILVFVGLIFILLGVLSFFNLNPGKALIFMILGGVLLSFGGIFLMPGSVGTTDPAPKGYH